MGKCVAFCVAFGDVVGVGCVAGLETLEFGCDGGEVLLRRFVEACVSLGDMVRVGCGWLGRIVAGCSSFGDDSGVD